MIKNQRRNRWPFPALPPPGVTSRETALSLLRRHGSCAHKPEAPAKETAGSFAGASGLCDLLACRRNTRPSWYLPLALRSCPTALDLDVFKNNKSGPRRRSSGRLSKPKTGAMRLLGPDSSLAAVDDPEEDSGIDLLIQAGRLCPSLTGYSHSRSREAPTSLHSPGRGVSAWLRKRSLHRTP